MKIFSIVGWSGSGKTSLITRLIERFRDEKRRVIAVKGTHAGYDLQPQGKDTARFLRAGAQEVYLMSEGELLRMTALASPDELLAELRSRLGADDIVLLEGLTRPGIPVIEVEDPRGRKALKSDPASLAAVVGNAGGGVPGRPRFRPDDIAGLSAFMEGCHGK
jgi:molybdopterin-guanine dinucleotide biosynthesis protein B